MKRTRTEIFIEVEETIAVRLSENTSTGRTAHIHSDEGQVICPQCGQEIRNVKKQELRSKNET